MTRPTIGTAGAQLVIATTLAISGYIHADLYVTGYRFIHVVGVLFLLQASASFALALLVLVGGPLLLRLASAGAASGALVGFLLSRTTGVYGFIERGWQPAPQSLISVLAEAVTVIVVAVTVLLGLVRPRPERRLTV
jgi:hypothetical protein